MMLFPNARWARPWDMGEIDIRATEWESALEVLKEEILLLAEIALGMVRSGVDLLGGGSLDGFASLLEKEAVADATHERIQMQCATLVASTSPLVKDLRVVAGVLQAATDLERIADEALDFARAIRRSRARLRESSLSQLATMASTARAMVEDAIALFVGHDLSLADRVADGDDIVDAIYAELLEINESQPEILEIDGSRPVMPVERRRALIDRVIAAHGIERIADHATNVAEWAVYLQTGEFISLNGAVRQWPVAADNSR